jgi:transposase
MKKYIVRLTEEERQELIDLVNKGTSPAYKIKHANILLKADANGPNWQDKQIVEAFGGHKNTIVNIRQRFVEQGYAAALERKKQKVPSRPRKLDGEGEARLIALGCSQPPDGYAKWSLRLLAEKIVELNVVDSISHEAVRQTLKKTNSSRT